MTKRTGILSFFILLKFGLQYFAIDSGYELHRDEYLHLDIGNHLAWGYSSVPPVTAWISFLVLQLGNAVFWVKFFPALFGALTVVIVWKAIEALKGNLFALILGSVCVIFSVLLRINTLYQPNSLEYLLWTLLLFAIIKYINSEHNKWIWVAAFSFAFGFLNKYNIAFLLLGLLPAILLTKQRKILVNKHFYLAILVSLIIISPNLVWQYNNDFPVIHHLETLSSTQLVNVNRFDFLKEQLLFFIGSIFVIILAFVSFFRYRPFKKYVLFFWTYIFIISIYFYLKAKGYYSIGLYPILLAFGSVYIEKLLSNGWLRYIRPLLVLIPIVVLIPIYQVLLPVLTPAEIVEKTALFERFGLLRWEDGKNHNLPQDFADMLGWGELAGIVDIAFDSITDKEHTIIHCDNYGQAGAINYYSKQQFTEAVSMNADYINWYPLDKIEIKNVILVKERTDTDIKREREMPFFDEITLVGEIKNKYAREYGTRVYLLKGSKQSINKILEEEILKRKRTN